jgi:hypothetical protein
MFLFDIPQTFVAAKFKSTFMPLPQIKVSRKIDQPKYTFDSTLRADSLYRVACTSQKYIPCGLSIGNLQVKVLNDTKLILINA